jgi:spermidine synthase
VLIGGLGIGMVLNAVLLKDEVEHVTVIELEPDVIKLVGPHYEAKFGDRLTIIQADVMQWLPPKGTVFDLAYFDIWPDICTDNLKDITALKRRWVRRAKVRLFWVEGLLRYQAGREKRDSLRFR